VQKGLWKKQDKTRKSKDRGTVYSADAKMQGIGNSSAEKEQASPAK